MGMAEKQNIAKGVVAAFKQALKNFGLAVECVLDELVSVNDRVEKVEGRLGEVEVLLVDLGRRLDSAELRAGVAKTQMAAEESLEQASSRLCSGSTTPEVKRVD